MRRFTILVADDDRDDFQTLCDAFGELDMQPVMEYVEDGRELLERLDLLLRTGNGCPDVVLLDLNMPRVNGIQALSEIRTLPRFPRLPVLIYTTTNDPAQRKQCLSLGANGFVTKGSSFSAIVQFAADLAGFIEVARHNPLVSFHRRKYEV